MAAKKKTKKKQVKVKPTKKKQVGAKANSKKAPVAKKSARNAKAKKAVKTAVKKRPMPRKRAAKKFVGKSPELSAGQAARKPAVAKKSAVARKRSGGSNPTMDVVESPLNLSRARTGGQSGDLQGLSNAEGSGSESVDELLEEGNSFEAGIVSGVESAGNADEEEVHTHEVLEDDVPDEYLDNER